MGPVRGSVTAVAFSLLIGCSAGTHRHGALPTPSVADSGCGRAQVHVTVGATTVRLRPFQVTTLSARVGDTLQLTATGNCAESVRFYEHGGRFADQRATVHLDRSGQREFNTGVSSCPHPSLTSCVSGVVISLGTLNVTTR